MPRQTSIQVTEATERQAADLKDAGFGTFTDIVRVAIDRMHREETANTSYLALSREQSADKRGEIRIVTIGEYGTLEQAKAAAVAYYTKHDPAPRVLGVVTLHDRQPTRTWVYQGLDNWLAELPLIRTATDGFKLHPLLAV